MTGLNDKDRQKLEAEYNRLRMESLKSLGDKSENIKPYRKNIDKNAKRLYYIRKLLDKEEA